MHINSFGRSAAHDVAIARGFYQAEGLDVQHAVTQSSKQQMQELVDGVWEIVHTNADNVFWWKQDNGADLVIVLALAGRANQDFVVRPEIATYEDLRGKTLAVDAAESGFATPLRLLLREHGISEEGHDFSFLEVGATQQRIDALQDGRAFGAMVGSAQHEELRARGFRVLDSINRLYRKYAGTAAVRRGWAIEHSETLVRYLRAHVRASQWPAEQAGAPPRKAEPFCWEGLEDMLRLRADAGLFQGSLDPRPFADDTYYRQAVASL